MLAKHLLRDELVSRQTPPEGTVHAYADVWSADRLVKDLDGALKAHGVRAFRSGGSFVDRCQCRAGEAMCRE
jgi:hypothetical protein